MTDKYLSDCLLKLCTYLKDDYQLKSLNLKVQIIFILDIITFKNKNCKNSTCYI